jgi:hypothetical protein
MPTRSTLQLTACLTVDGDDECRVFKPHRSWNTSLASTSTHDVLLHPDIALETGLVQRNNADAKNSADVFCPRSVSFSQEGDFHTPTTDHQTLPRTTYNCYTLDKPYLAIG